MERLANICGAILMIVGVFSALGGCVALLDDRITAITTWVLLGSGVGTFLLGVFFASLAEIISRLPNNEWSDQPKPVSGLFDKVESSDRVFTYTCSNCGSFERSNVPTCSNCGTGN